MQPLDTPDREDLDAKCGELFGSELSDGDCYKMGGCVFGRVEAEAHCDGQTFSLIAKGTVMVGGKEVTYEAKRTAMRDGRGLLVMWNDTFKASEKKTGLGSKMMLAEAEYLKDAQFDKIETFAAMSDSMNGAVTWAKCGYDGKLPDETSRKLRLAAGHGELPPEAAHITTMHQLMDLAGGEEWWERNAQGWYATFDLKTDDCLNRLKAYMGRQR